MSMQTPFIAKRALAITPHDTNINAFMGIYIGGAGNLVVETEGGDTVTFTAPPVGSVVWVSTRRVKAATTATLLVGLLPNQT